MSAAKSLGEAPATSNDCFANANLTPSVWSACWTDECRRWTMSA